MQIFLLDGVEMTDRETAYDYLSRILRLPDYFGRNLDGLKDCLEELGTDCIIILQNSFFLIDHLNQYGKRILEIFEEVSQQEDCFTFIKK